MRNKAILIILVILVAGSFTLRADNSPKKVIVAGKVLNYNLEIPLTILLNRIGVKNEEVALKIDKEGNFHGTFETYVPLDAWITYKTNLLIVLQPNDSLYITFDGSSNKRPEILSSIQFGGNDAVTNSFIAKFQRMYFSNSIYTNWDKKAQAIKEYNPSEYILYNDSVRQKGKNLYDEFVKQYSPNEKSRKWASFFIDNNYYDNIAHYAVDHREAHDMDWDNHWTVPKGFYEALEQRLPIHPSTIMNGYSLDVFADRYTYYVNEKLKGEREEDSEWDISAAGGLGGITHIVDSIKVNGILKHVSDNLLKEIMLTRFFQNGLNRQELTTFEKYKTVFETHIQEPFLKEALYTNYLETKNRIERPEFHTETLLKEVDETTIKEIINEIIEANKGKVIYLDFWAT